MLRRSGSALASSSKHCADGLHVRKNERAPHRPKRSDARYHTPKRICVRSNSTWESLAKRLFNQHVNAQLPRQTFAFSFVALARQTDIAIGTSEIDDNDDGNK